MYHEDPPPYGKSPYPQGQPYYPPVAPPTSPLAITSLVTGILGMTAFPLVGSLIAIITGHMARNEIARSQGQVGGKGMAMAGLVLGYLAVVSAIVLVGIVLVAMVFFVGVAKSFDSQQFAKTIAKAQVQASIGELPPGASVELKVRTIAAAVSDEPIEDITTETALEDLGLDDPEALAHFEENLSEVFGVHFDHGEPETWTTVADVIRSLQAHAPALNSPEVMPEPEPAAAGSP